jgi:sugar phosphate permease
MTQVNEIGMLLYLILSIVGGFLTGYFSRYVYQLSEGELPKLFTLLFTAVFYIAPCWAILSLFKDDDLDVFYLLLIVSFCIGLFLYKPHVIPKSKPPPYQPEDDD